MISMGSALPVGIETPLADITQCFLKSLFNSICKIVHVRNTCAAFSCGLRPYVGIGYELCVIIE